jgi:hypothetical protein
VARFQVSAAAGGVELLVEVLVSSGLGLLVASLIWTLLVLLLRSRTVSESRGL